MFQHPSASVKEPAQSVYSPLLQTNGSLVWGETETFRIWMTIVTFNKYVHGVLISKHWKQDERPFISQQQVLEVMNENLKVEKWAQSWKLNDPEIHFLPKEVSHE